MVKSLIDEVNLLRKKGDYEYIIYKYVDRHTWINKFKNSIKDKYCYNMTDFNYSTCFTVWINITDTDVEIGGEEFNKFLDNNDELLIASIEISVIAPYYVITYLRYTKDNVQYSFSPYNRECNDLEERIVTLLEDEGNKRLYEEELNIIISDVKLELKEDDVTIYNCLFEDSY